MSLQSYLGRIKELQKQVLEWGVDALLIENTIDIYYLTGLSISTGSLLISRRKAELFVDGRYFTVCKEKSPCPVFIVSEKMGKGLKKVGFDSETTSFARAQRLKKSLPLKPCPHPLRKGRSVKDAGELKRMKKSAAILWKGFEHLKRHLKEGISEKEAAFLFEMFCRKLGAEGLAFESIIAFGKNTALPHHRAGEARLKKGDLILCDIGVIFERYRSDMTRVLFSGKVDPRLMLMEGVVREAQKAALSLCRPGTKVKELDIAARKVMQRANMEDLFVHNLGHGIGLETHEFPRIRYNGDDKDVVLEEGMVFTVEPGLYIPGLGGVRHEDTIVITAKGYQNFYA